MKTILELSHIKARQYFLESQNYLLDSIHDIQTLITCTGVEDFVNHRFSINKVFHVQNGQVTKEN